MYKPTLQELPSSRDVIDVFGGYNHNMRIGSGEFYDMQNLTSAYYPLLAPRRQRGTYLTPDDNPRCLIEKDALCYVFKRGTNLFFIMNEQEYDLGITPIDAAEERRLVSMGAYVVIFPDRLYINTKDTTEKGSIDAEFTTSGTVTYELCDAEGNPYVVNETSVEEPAEPTDKMIWLDRSSTPASLKQFSEASGMWIGIASVYVKISSTNLGKAFEQYDGVNISGVSADIAPDLNATSVVWAKDDNSITVVGIINENSYVQNTAITVTRKMPEMDFVIESNNRLWGCRYGLQDGKVVNELYACKQADFKNWNCYMGISTDSYRVSLGADGQFTGAISYLGYPTFFKENCCYVVYGNMPREYKPQETALRGVQKGSEKSLAMVNEVLYYKSRTGICAYSGALPTEISSALGENSYSNAVACAYKNKYYITMLNKSTNSNEFFVFDVEKGMWHKEDDLKAECFCAVDDEVYYISDGSIRTLFGSGTKDTEKIKWMAETGDLGVDAPDKKYISRLSVRLSMDIGTRVYISIKYDSSGGWERICSLTGNTLRTFTLPIKPKRCDHLKLKFEGEGDAKIYAISKTVEIGSDV
jgi:hypothetical protein